MLTQVIPRTVFNNILVAILFGILVPYIKGIEYLDLFLLLPYSFLCLFFVVPLVVDSVFALPDKGVRLGPLFRSVGIGWFTGVAVLWMGIATVSFRSGRLVAPPAAVGLALAVISLLGSIFAAALSAWVANRVRDASAAKGRLRIGFLLVLVVFFAMPRVLSDDRFARLLHLLTPEGIVKLTLVLVPIVAISSVVLLIRLPRQ